MKHLSLFVLCSLILYSCSLNDWFEPNTTYKETTTIGDYMYQVEADMLSTFDISDPNNLRMVNETRLNAEIESLTSFGEVLFIGSGGSLISFKINSNGIPFQDNIVSQMTFSPDQTACDFMVMSDNLVFVALIIHDNPNVSCSRFMNDNTIQVYDITELSEPVLLSSLVLSDLKDIATDNDLLFVSDGSNGFKVFNKSNPSNLEELYHIQDFNTQDVVINNNGMLIVAGDSELRQYDYTDIDNLREVNRIEL